MFVQQVDELLELSDATRAQPSLSCDGAPEIDNIATF